MSTKTVKFYVLSIQAMKREEKEVREDETEVHIITHHVPTLASSDSLEEAKGLDWSWLRNIFRLRKDGSMMSWRLKPSLK